MKKILLLTFVLMFSCRYIYAGESAVAVAANVQYAFEELKTIFEKDTGITIKSIVGSSGKFAAQIENGAPFDVFLSADMNYPAILESKGLTYNSPQIYVYGTLVLWTMKDMDLTNGLQVLLDPAVKTIAVASPNTAPYGFQSINALKKSSLFENLESKLVYGESIAQTNQFISTGASDIGLTAKSAVLAPNMINQGKWIEVERALYEPIEQGVVILKYAEQHNLGDSKKLYEFLLSKSAGKIYQKYGYTLP